MSADKPHAKAEAAGAQPSKQSHPAMEEAETKAKVETTEKATASHAGQAPVKQEAETPPEQKHVENGTPVDTKVDVPAPNPDHSKDAVKNDSPKPDSAKEVLVATTKEEVPKSNPKHTDTDVEKNAVKSVPANNVRTHLPSTTNLVLPGDEKEIAMRQTLAEARDLTHGRDVGNEAHRAALAKEFAEIIDYMTKLLGSQKVGRDITTRALVYLKSDPHIPTRVALGRARGDKKRQLEEQLQSKQVEAEVTELDDASKTTTNGEEHGANARHAEAGSPKVDVDIKVEEPEAKDKSFTDSNAQAEEVENAAAVKAEGTNADRTTKPALTAKDPNTNMNIQDNSSKDVNGTGKNAYKKRRWYPKKGQKHQAGGGKAKENAQADKEKTGYAEEATAMMQ